ncbi:hypothetical protein [Streptomyces qinglanensis]|uniref:Uncharacterized protein n=1 Tax=Streptomyces qinglanensis TaxID=943816 RepID=A0A1H9PR26_9ACTN|nr:hypothetical protein [Streptomyces qinglanensis]SER50647.1 hypothetical protein SAMN05421870_102194 [Streptomyces qinglanensis]
MTTQPEEPMHDIADSDPEAHRIAQPASTPEELRAALALIAPDALPTFDDERAAALRQSREQVSAAPMRRFAGQWAVYVAIERHPARAARLRALENRAAETDDIHEARELAAEIGRILDAACAEAGIDQEQGAA